MADGSTDIVLGVRPETQTSHYFNVYKTNGKIYFLDFQKDELGFQSRIMTQAELSNGYSEFWLMNTTGK